MEVSIHEAAKRLGEIFPFTWKGKLKEQSFNGRKVIFAEDAEIAGTVAGDSAGFTVTAEAKAPLQEVCARCNKSFVDPFSFSFTERFQRPALITEEADVYPYEGDVLELEEAFLDNLFLQLPMVSLCKPECKGLCPLCGADLNQGRCACTEKNTDSAFAALRSLTFENKEV